MLVELLVANLVENAARHNVTGGKVSVVTAGAAAGSSLTVSNTGPLVPEAALPGLFQPFQTAHADRIQRPQGHGLGLAIVRAAADAHGATVAARPRPSGGLEVTVRFPPPALTARRDQPPL